LTERPGFFGGFARWIDELPGGVVFAIALMSIALVGIVDELSGYEVDLTPLYLLPIWLAAWFLGAAGGLALALAGAVAWWAADVATRAYAPRTLVEVLNFAMELVVFATVALLVAAVRRRLRSESGLARTDPLTGLLNRRGFLEVARREMARSRRNGRAITVAMIDVDHFKEVNDRRGHEAGDHLLAGLGAALRASTRSVDACARVGGDEFAVLLPETDGTGVEGVLDRMRMVLVEAGSGAAEDDGAVTVSVGAATFASAPSSLDEMLRAADRMLREVKAAGRNGLRYDAAASLAAAARDPARPDPFSG
jgi:diguanylate cyclase (GGDEF)-like protein